MKGLTKKKIKGLFSRGVIKEIDINKHTTAVTLELNESVGLFNCRGILGISSYTVLNELVITFENDILKEVLE